MTQRSDLPEVLGAESLLLALLTFAYGLVYQELSAAADIKLGGRQLADVGADRARVRAARWRARGLATVAVIVAAVFTPPALEVLWNFLERVPKGLDAFDNYNAVATTLVLVTIGCYALAGHALWMSTRLSATLWRLSTNS
jgi:hypothetical protein